MSTLSNHLLERLATRSEHCYYGKYRGKVTDNSDPLNIGRLKAKVPAVLDTEETGWALPAFPYGGASEQGSFMVPDKDANVWIEFEGGDLSYPIWSGTFFSSGVPESAKAAQKVLKTKSGHKIVLDDDANTVEITDSNGNSIKMDSSVIKVSAGQATKIVIDAPQIELVENASHALVFGDDLLQYLNQAVQTYSTHTHPGQMAGPIPVSPMVPVPPLSPPTPSLLSQKVKTG